MADKKSTDLVAKWRDKIRRADKSKSRERFIKQAEEAERDYWDDRKDGNRQLFNVFFSQVQTLQSRLYAKPPNPDARRRFDLQGPEGQAAKEAAMVVERSLGTLVDITPFHSAADRAVSDFLVAGLGVLWLEYEPKIIDTEMGPMIAEQRVLLKHVPWKRFHWECGKDWDDVDWVARDHYLSANEIYEQFGQRPTEAAVEKEEKDDYKVTEIYFRPKRQRIVIAECFDEPLEVAEDQLGLSGFFPCPQPMMANIRSKELVPMPDHAVYAKSYEYINRLVQRIQSITAQIKIAGFYDAQLSELGHITATDDGAYVPVSNLTERLASTGITDFSRVLATLPIAEKVTVVRELQALLMGEKARLDEHTGIADVVRGATNPNETAAAQQIKSSWANVRLSRKTSEVNRCLRDAFRIMAEIVAEHFTPESLFLLTGQQVNPFVMQVLKSDMIRTLAIDVETDSTVAIEDEEEKRQKIEFLNYVTPFLQNMLPAIQSGALPGDVGKELILFAIRAFKHGRQLEDAIEAAPGTMQQLAQFQQQLQQSQQQMQQMQQATQQAQQQAQQAQAQLQQVNAQDDQIRLAGTQAKAQAETAKAGAAVQVAQLKVASEQMKRFGGMM